MKLSLGNFLSVGNGKNVIDEGDTLPVIVERTLMYHPHICYVFL